jgi:hypothetical protein
MASPIIICNGIIRSGSTWSFNVCRLLGNLLAQRRHQIPTSAYLSPETLDHFLETGAASHEGPAVIKAHELGPIAQESIHTGRAKAICTIRDPRDCVASDIPFWGKGFDPSVGRVVLSLKYIASSSDFGRTLFIRYEQMLEDPHSEIRKIAAFLRIPVIATEVESIDAQTNLDACTQICQALSSRPPHEAEEIANNHRRDPTTLLHDNHLGTAKVARWKQDLTPEQGQFLTQLFNRSLKALGYETANSNEPAHISSPQSSTRNSLVS